MSKKIALIAPPVFSQRSLAFMPHNIGLGYLAAYLEQNGHTVQIIDAVADGLDCSQRVYSWGRQITQTGLPHEETVKRIDADVDWIGITVPFTMYADVVKALIPQLKERFSQVPIVMGGVYPSTLPEDALAIPGVDFVVARDGEIPFLKLVEGVAPAQIKGIWYKNGPAIISNGDGEVIDNLDDIPFPARHLFPMERYVGFSPRGARASTDRTMSLITSRACPYKCTFCSIHAVSGRVWRARSPENVLEEIRQLALDYNVNHIQFEDDNLTLNKDRCIKIFEGLTSLSGEIGKKLTWSCSNGVRADTLDLDVLKRIKASGCTQLCFAVESGDPMMLGVMKKKLSDIEQIQEVAKNCRDLCLETQAFMIVGYPEETEKSFRTSLDYFLRLKENGIGSFAIHLLKAYPQTALYEQCKREGYLVNTEGTHTRSIEDGGILSRRYVGIVGPEFTAEEVLRRRDHAHKVLNPRAYYAEKYPWLQDLESRVRPHLPNAVLKRASRVVRGLGGTALKTNRGDGRSAEDLSW